VVENHLFPVFELILIQDVVEFMPYTFQIMALLLDIRTEGSGVPATYEQLLPFLLKPDLWDRSGNVPAMARLLRAFVKVGGRSLELTPLLGVSQKLISSKANDHHGFMILNALLQFVSYDLLADSMPAVMVMLLRRLQSNRTLKFTKGLIVFFCLLVVRKGAVALFENLEKLQAGMFKMVIEKVIIRDLQKLDDSLEKKICAVAICHLLVDTYDQLGEFRVGLLSALVALLELPETTGSGDEDGDMGMESTTGYSNAYCQLAFATPAVVDPTGVDNVHGYLAKTLQRISTGRPGALPQLLNSLEAPVKQHLANYANAAAISLN